MINLAIALFAVTAVLGLTILIRWLTKKEASKGVIYSHGIVAAAALVILMIYGIKNPDNFPKISIILFVTGAIGGFYMFFNDLRKKPHQLAVAFIHALLAIGGFITLLAYAYA